MMKKTYKKPKSNKQPLPEYSFGGFLKKTWNTVKDPLLFVADQGLSAVGAGNVIQSDDYTNEKFGKFSDKVFGITGAIGETAIGALTGGASLKATNALKGVVGDPMAEKQAQQAEQQQLLRNQQLAGYYSKMKPNSLYSPTFKRGGKVKYPNGGGVEDDGGMYTIFQKDVPMSDNTNRNARLYAYKQMLDKALMSKNKDLYNELSTGIVNKDLNSRLAYADSLAKANPSFALSVDEQRQVLGDSYDDFNTLRDWRVKGFNKFGNNASVAGSNEQEQIKDTAYGARNSAFYDQSRHFRRANTPDGKAIADYTAEASYDPTTKQYSYAYSRKPIMAQGGIMKPNAELEQGEPYRMPDGQIGMVSNEAPTHAEGGVPMNLPQGTEILGKNVAPNGEQYKVIGQKLKKAQDRYEKVLVSHPTEIAKRTAKMMLDKVQKEYDALFAQQETEKSIPTVDQFGPGGVTTEDDYLSMYGTSKMKGLYADTPYQIASGVRPDINKAFTGRQSTAAPQSNVNGPNFNDIAGAIGEYAPIAYNLITGLKKPRQLNPEAYQNPYESASLAKLSNMKYDPNLELTSNRNQQAAYNRGVRGLGLSGGQVASNLAAGSIGRMRADADTMTKANRINTEYQGQYANALGQFGQNRATTNKAIEDINTRERAAREATLQTGLSQLSQATQAGKLRNNMILRDAQRLGLLDSLVQNYVLTSDGKWVSKATGQAMTSDDMMKFIKGK